VWLDPLQIFGDTRVRSRVSMVKRICNEHISMPPKETTEEVAEEKSSFSKSTRKVRDFFSIPAPVKQLFDLVPVVTYPPNQLPLRAPKPARIPSLYVFSKDQDAAAGRPSFNPSCLKWQVGIVRNPILELRTNTVKTFLNIAGVDHRLISSNNHSSPTGSLPFLLPAIYGSNTSQDSLTPITSNKFINYATEHGGKVEESSGMRYEAYQSLLDHRIRNAWVSNQPIL
jgi:metaxin